MAEPIGVAFIEIEPVATGFSQKAAAQLRTQTAAQAAATRSVSAEAAAQTRAAAAVGAKGAAEARAATSTSAHAAASNTARNAILAETAAVTGLRGASLGVSPAFLGATAAAIALFQSIDEAAEFEEQIKLIGQATRGTEEDIERASDRSRELGRSLDLPNTTATQAATAINLLARSGFNLEESMTAAEGALLLTSAGGEELKASVQILDQVIDAYSLTAADAVRVTDQLAIGSEFTQGSVSEFAGALSSVAGAADSIGLSLEDTNTLLLQLAESGLSSSAGAAVLRTTLLRLNDISPEAAKQLERIGLSVDDLRDGMGNLRPDAFVILAEALNKLDEAEQRRVLTQIFSRRAALGVLRLTEQERAGYDAAAEAARRQGVALEQARARAESFRGQTRELRANLSDLGLTLGNIVVPGLTDSADAINDVVAAGRDLAALVPGGNEFLGLTGELLGLAIGPVPIPVKGFRLMKEGFLGLKDVIEGGAPVVVSKLDETSLAVQNLITQFQAQGGLANPRGFSTLLSQLDGMADRLSKGDKESQKLAKSIRTIIAELKEAGRVPDIAVKMTLQTGDLTTTLEQQLAAAERRARQAGADLPRGFVAGIESGFPIIGETGRGMIDALIAEVRKGGGRMRTLGEDTVRQFSLGAQVAIAQAAGDQGAELSALQEQLANAQAHLRRMKERFQAGDVSEQGVINAASRVSQLQGQVEAILAQQEADSDAAAAKAEQHANNIAQARDKRDQAVLNSISSEESRRTAKVIAKQATAGLADDIAANVALRNFYRRAIETAQDEIRDAGLLKSTLQTLRLAKAAVVREIARLQEERKREAAETRVEQARLDLELVEIQQGTGTGDATARQVQREIAARNRVIAALKKAQDLTKKGTVEWKRLRNEIAREQAAIKELRKQRAEADKNTLDDFRNQQRQMFEFLQTQQGFAANLIGNLIPSTATAGLVGTTQATATLPTTPAGTTAATIPDSVRVPTAGTRTATIPSPFQQQRATDATGPRPFTSGQGNTTNELLRQILREVRRSNEGDAHPEANRQRRAGAAAFDYGGGGGTMGM